MNPIRILLITIGFVALVAGVLGFVNQQRPATPTITTATVYPTPHAIADFDLVDADGNAVGREFFEGEWDLVFFGFTHCPDICPVTLQILSAARRQIQDEGHAPLPRIVLVSVDPERDTPEKLNTYIAYFGDGVAGLTGTLGGLRELAMDLGVFFQKAPVDEETGFYNVDHSSVVLLVDPDAQVRGLYTAPQRAEQIAADYAGVLAL